jgi:general secretion pathway protein A
MAFPPNSLIRCDHLGSKQGFPNTADDQTNMYETFYGLREKAFSILPNPRLIYWGRMHRMAAAMLEFGVVNQAGFVVITGEIGSGKTTLVRYLLTRFTEAVTTGTISNTPQGRDELLRWIMLSLNLPMEGEYLVVFKRFQDFLYEQERAGRTTILIIDEAQNLGLEALEELRMLSNINTDNRQLLQLILVGQPQLRDKLLDPRLAQFAQRVSVDFHLRALDEPEVASYIEFRLKAAGAERQIFSEEACSLIGRASRGLPRVINILCDTALVYGFASEAPVITGELVAQVIADRKAFGSLPVGTTE